MKKINLHFFILLNILITVVLSDTLIFFTNVGYLYSITISFVLVIISNFLLIKNKKLVVSSDFNKFDIVFCVILGVMTLFTIIYPDSFWDTKSYHVYLQENPFADKINFDFFAGRNLNSFQFPIADRVFYLFRVLLGYRLGTIISYYLIVVIYYQIKRIFSEIEIFKGVSKLSLSVLSSIPLCLFVILEQTGTYYIDNFSLILILELFLMCFFRKDVFLERINIIFIALIIGFAVGIKVSNLVLMFPIVLYLLINNFRDIKKIKLIDYFCLIIIFFVTFLPYLIDNILQTGSPIFPYYNNIFNSKYFADINWQDGAFGYKNLKELIIWPLYTFIYPLRAYNYGLVDRAWYFGYIVSIVYILQYYFKFLKIKINKKINDGKYDQKKLESIQILKLSIFILIEYFLWSKFLVGYTRYASFIPVIATILIVSLMVKMIKDNNIVLTIILCFLICSSTMLTIKQYFQYKPSVLKSYILNGKKIATEEFKINFKYLFNDRNIYKIDIDGAWISVRDDSAVPTLIRSNEDPIYDIEKWATITNDLTKSLYYEKINNIKLFAPLNYSLMEQKISLLSENKFEILPNVKKYKNIDFLENSDVLYVSEIKYNDKLISNNNYILNSNNISNEVEIPLDGDYNYNAYITNLNPMVDNFKNNAKIELYGKKDDHIYIIDTKGLNNENDFIYFNFIQYKNEIDKYEYVGIRIVNDETQINNTSVLVITSEKYLD